MKNGIKQGELDLIKQGVKILARQNKENELALIALAGLIQGIEDGKQSRNGSNIVLKEGEK